MAAGGSRRRLYHRTLVMVAIIALLAAASPARSLPTVALKTEAAESATAAEAGLTSDDDYAARVFSTGLIFGPQPGDPAASAKQSCTVDEKLVPSCAILQGALVAPVDGQTPESAFRSYEQLVGVRQRIVSFYHEGTELFPTGWEMRLARQPGASRLLLMNWKPENDLTWAQVASGLGDAVIDREAQYLRANFHERFFLSIHHEPEDEVDPTPGSGYTAGDYAAMYRHVVDRLRANGVDNAVTVMQYMGAQSYGVRPWYDQLWPGDSYVDWVAFDSYQTEVLNGQTGGFDRMMNVHWGNAWPGAYEWSVTQHPGKPIMMAEWGLSEKPGDPWWKPWLFRSVLKKLGNYPALKAMVYFDRAVPEGDVRVDTSPASLKAYQELSRSGVFGVK